MKLEKLETLQPGMPKWLTRLSLIGVILFLIWLGYAVCIEQMPVKNTMWALAPPVIAIMLALITKEVYSSLFLGILTGALLNADFDPVGGLNRLFPDGIMAMLVDKWNVGILVFLVILGTMVQLMNRTGGSAAFGTWAANRIKSREGAQLSTMLLGCLIFIDDYFNCLTVGSVMRPVTDKHKISRAKLAYLIDSTAAPICIIAPISSWAAAVSGFVKGENGISIFVQSIPFNFYALLTMLMMVLIICMKIDFGSMLLHENNARQGDLFTSGKSEQPSETSLEEGRVGQVSDMFVPVILLVIGCVIGLALIILLIILLVKLLKKRNKKDEEPKNDEPKQDDNDEVSEDAKDYVCIADEGGATAGEDSADEPVEESEEESSEPEETSSSE